MRIPLKYAGKTIYVEPYNTRLERELILFNEISDVPDIEGVLDILENNITGDIENLSQHEKLAILFKLRSLSIGEEIGVKFQCKCGAPNESVINISEIITSGEGTMEINDVLEPLTNENFHKFVDVDVDELDFDEYDKLFLEVQKNVTTFSFTKGAECIACRETQWFDISDDAYVINSLSDDSVMSIYQTISDLVFFGKYTKLDIDSMIPFERTLFVGILNKTREELNK